MEILKHRTNLIEKIDSRFGAEIDIREHNGKIVLSHNIPNKNCIDLATFLDHFSNDSLLAINVKSSEIENELKKILESKNHKKYFAFDFAFPSLRNALKIELNCAFRLSEYEKDLHPNCGWVWIDCFNEIWYDEKYLEMLKEKRYNIAVVSPEIHNRSKNKDEFQKIRGFSENGLIHAICTDTPELW